MADDELHGPYDDLIEEAERRAGEFIDCPMRELGRHNFEPTGRSHDDLSEYVCTHCGLVFWD